MEGNRLKLDTLGPQQRACVGHQIAFPCCPAEGKSLAMSGVGLGSKILVLVIACWIVCWSCDVFSENWWVLLQWCWLKTFTLWSTLCWDSGGWLSCCKKPTVLILQLVSIILQIKYVVCRCTYSKRLAWVSVMESLATDTYSTTGQTSCFLCLCLMKPSVAFTLLVILSMWVFQMILGSRVGSPHEFWAHVENSKKMKKFSQCNFWVQWRN